MIDAADFLSDLVDSLGDTGLFKSDLDALRALKPMIDHSEELAQLDGQDEFFAEMQQVYLASMEADDPIKPFGRSLLSPDEWVDKARGIVEDVAGYGSEPFVWLMVIINGQIDHLRKGTAAARFWNAAHRYAYRLHMRETGRG